MKTSRARSLSYAAVAACIAGKSALAMDVPFGTLAVNLECLGAEFYSFAAYGQGISEELRGGGPPSVGGRKAFISTALKDIVTEMAEEKAAHLALLRDVLEDKAPPCPEMDIGPAFAAAADAAIGEPQTPPFSPYTDDTLFLHAAFLLQDVFATAYAGAKEPEPGLEDVPTLFASADSYFAGAIRVLLLLKAKASNPTPYGPIIGLVDAMSDFRDSADGPKDLDQGIGEITAGEEPIANLLPADEDGLPYSRDAKQILAIFTLGGGAAGGFFPEGMAGAAAAAAPVPAPAAAPVPAPMRMRARMPPPAPAAPPPEPVVAETVQVDIPLSSGTGAMCTGTCEYRVTADMVWNARTHPVDYPAGVAHWSPFYMVTHDASYVLWRFGEMANAGIQQIAELGAGFDFFEEVEQCGTSCSEGVQFACNPFSGTCSGSGIITATPERPLLSVASMIAPSPDWFTGVDAWPLCVDGEWIQGREADVDAYDAGTDSGPSFQSPDEVEMIPISNFRDITPLSDSIFYDPATGAMLTVGNIAVELVGCD